MELFSCSPGISEANVPEAGMVDYNLVYGVRKLSVWQIKKEGNAKNSPISYYEEIWQGTFPRRLSTIRLEIHTIPQTSVTRKSMAVISISVSFSILRKLSIWSKNYMYMELKQM